MVFLAGPRQVGKTTLARQRPRRLGAGVYLSWDNREDRRRDPRRPLAGRPRSGRAGRAPQVAGVEGVAQGRVRQAPRAPAVPGHRQRSARRLPAGWRLAAGKVPPPPPPPVLLRRGTASRGAERDSARGASSTSRRAGDQDLVEALLQYGGFPEPFLAQSARTLRRWQKERLDRFFREDVRDLEPVRDLSTFQLLADLLPERVGSLLSLNALREDLEVSHRASTHWMDVLETMYHVFRVRPFAGPRARALDQDAEGLPVGLEPRPGPRRPLREPRGLAPAQALPLSWRTSRGTPWSSTTCATGRVARWTSCVTAGRKPWFAVEAKLSRDPRRPGARPLQGAAADALGLPGHARGRSGLRPGRRPRRAGEPFPSALV